MLLPMNASFASGLSAYQGAAAQLSRAAGKIASPVRTTILPSASVPPGAGTPGAPAAPSTAPIPRGGRAPSFDIEALVGIIKATHQAQLAATSIRAADDLVGELLDVTA
ncbi:hypothetical protein E5163_10740 [Marinicauda algicola]|uniref:Uncharacterized protein n=1 Tax=Marinicauda algicola TaxID=2029849 RepID=A0A4S2GYY2_9PROT|nr:hypothetical protein [Marinicauda algicola]TGY88293.1 hypothetical protein E5163_10740 [Marinicauda algicola]